MVLTIEVCYVLAKAEQTKESTFLTQEEELLQLRQENQALQKRLAQRAKLTAYLQQRVQAVRGFVRRPVSLWLHLRSRH